MNNIRTLLAATVLVASAGAHAQVTGQLGGGTGSFLALSGPASCSAVVPCTLGGTVATIVGGSTYAADQTFADIPAGGSIFGGNFLASGPTSGMPSTLTFTTPVTYISFLWGSPDLYNALTVNSTHGPQTFSAMGLGFSTTNGNQGFSQYVEFIADPSVMITSLVFSNNPGSDAFETANFSVIAAVPEPETYALMLAGLAALGVVASRRKRV